MKSMYVYLFGRRNSNKYIYSDSKQRKRDNKSNRVQANNRIEIKLYKKTLSGAAEQKRNFILFLLKLNVYRVRESDGHITASSKTNVFMKRIH